MYTPVDPKVDFPKQEEAVLRFWEDHDVFKKSVAQREGADEYVFFDGPPFATGLLHFGHFVPSTIKDIIPRYQTMKGKKVERHRTVKSTAPIWRKAMYEYAFYKMSKGRPPV